MNAGNGDELVVVFIAGVDPITAAYRLTMFESRLDASAANPQLFLRRNGERCVS